MSRFTTLFLTLCFLGIFCGILRAEDQTVVASNYSDRYHLKTCKIAAKIPTEELLTFKSSAEAEAAGYAPCKKCHPSTVTTNLQPRKSKKKLENKN